MSAAVPGPTERKAAQPDFWDRFMAWWNGHELVTDGAFRAPSGADGHGIRYEEAGPHWETARLRIAQEVWGEGFSSPGGAEYILNLVKFFALDPSMSVLDLGAGLGGASRAMSQEFGVWVTGLEADEHLAKAGMEISKMAGLGKKAAIAHFVPEEMDIKPKSIDCVFSKEFLFTIADKTEFLGKVEHLMKPRGQLLFTDYVVAGRALNSKTIEHWKELEPVAPHPWAVEDYEEALTKLHLDIRVIEDNTDQFHGMVTKAWAEYIKELQSKGAEPEDGAALVDEVELWSRRIQAVQAGDLKVCRIHALKRDTNRLMSAW